MVNQGKWRAILLFGMPGSGKGTQGKVLGSLLGFLHIATGDIFRNLSKLGPLGKEVDRYTSEGKLVPDELTVQVWRNHMGLLSREGKFDPAKQIIILDGLPRTYAQAKIIDDQIQVLRIYYLKLQSDEEAVERIKARALKEGRVDDAREVVIRKRLETFYQETKATIEYYDPSLVTDVNASRRPIEILAELARDLGTRI